MAMDLVIEVDNRPGALAKVAAAISDAGVNLAAATCVGMGDRAELHILVPHAEAARHALAITHQAVVTPRTRGRRRRRRRPSRARWPTSPEPLPKQGSTSIWSTSRRTTGWCSAPRTSTGLKAALGKKH